MSQQGENDEEIYNTLASIDETDAISISSSMSATRVEEILNNAETYGTSEIQSDRRFVRSEENHRIEVETMIPVGIGNSEQQPHNSQMIAALVQNHNRIAFYAAIERLNFGERLRSQDIRVLHTQLLIQANELQLMRKRGGGLTGEEIRKAISSKIFEETSNIKEFCCICQEELINGEECGKLDCEHTFHLKCIRKWLVEKNMCPLCKCKGLVFVDEVVDG